MKTPDEKFTTYSPEQWNEVKSILGLLGVDGDEVTVGKHRLRDELEYTARWYLRFSKWEVPKRTPKQRNEMIREALNEIEAVRRRFEPHKIGDVATYASAEARSACAALADLVAALELKLDEDAGSRSHANASKGVRNGYLFDLIKVWDQIDGSQQAQRKLKVDFFLACSAPPFQTNSKAINYFLDRQPKTSI
jgi:hypothetical protein